MNKVKFCSLSLLLLFCTSATADQVTLDAVKDSGFFAGVDPDTGDVFPTPNNFGAHLHVPVATANNFRRNRGVFEFDLSSIPSDATINSATFDFEVTAQGGFNGQSGVDFDLHRVTTAWDEGTGTSNIGNPTGDGVTWSMSTGTNSWTTLGGDFDPMVIGAVFVDGPALNYTISGSELVTVIQGMVDGSLTNNGFLLKGAQEGAPGDAVNVLGSAARVTTREGGRAAQLIVDFETGDFILGDVNQDGSVDLLDVSPFVELLVSGGFQSEADINGDGEVNLLDVSPFVDLLTGG